MPTTVFIESSSWLAALTLIPRTAVAVWPCYPRFSRSIESLSVECNDRSIGFECLKSKRLNIEFNQVDSFQGKIFGLKKCLKEERQSNRIKLMHLSCNIRLKKYLKEGKQLNQIKLIHLRQNIWKKKCLKEERQSNRIKLMHLSCNIR